MFTLRRAALRAFIQPTWRNPAFRTVLRSIPVLPQKPAVTRAFHQSRLWRAEEDRKTSAEQASPSPAEAESQIERDSTEPSAEEMRKEVKEESIATPEVADAAPSGSRTDAQPNNAVEQASEIAANAAQNVRDAASGAMRQARDTIRRNPARSDGSSGKVLYIGNLLFEVHESHLRAEFANIGEVTNCRVVMDDRGRSKGFGFVEFATQEQAERAIEQLDQKVLQGRRMTVQHHIPKDIGLRHQHARKQNPPCPTLFIGNMSYQMSDRDLNDLFREIRNVLDVRVAIDRRSGQPRGFAHADFIDTASAERAKQLLEQKVVYGRKLRVDFGVASANAPPA